jgi:hypothetical protein
MMRKGTMCVFIETDWPERLETIFDDKHGWPEAKRVSSGQLAMYMGDFMEVNNRLCIVKMPHLDGYWVVEKTSLTMLDDDN